MHEWEVKISAAKDEKSLEHKSWVETVKAMDKVEAGSKAIVQAMKKRPNYAEYHISTIIEVEA